MLMVVDTREVYARSSDCFAERVHVIGDRWAAPTPLPGWDVRALVHHLVEEEVWAPPLLAGKTIAEVGDQFAGDLLGNDPTAAFDAAAAAALDAVRAEGSMERTVHLSFGDFPGQEYVMQLAADHLVHAWDLATALGVDDTLDAEAVEAVATWFADREDAYRAAGAIGPRVEVPASASPQARLIGSFGRTP
jgi:uncharacterized protein (TIGR03086 family)